MTTVEESIPDNELLASIPLPEGWLWTTVSSLGEFDGEAVKTGPFGAILKSKEFVSSGVPILAVGNVQSGRLDLQNARVDHITEEKADELSDYRLRAGDVLFTRSGTIGRSAVVPQSADGWMMSYHLLRVRPNQLLINPQYLYFVFAGCQASQQYTQDSTIGTTRPGINTQILKHLPVPLPPRAEQDRAVATINELFSRVGSARDHLSKIPVILKRFRQAVLASACSGKLTEDWRGSQASLEASAESLTRAFAERKQEFEAQCARAKAKDKRLPAQPDNLEPLEFSLPEPLVLPEIPEEWAWTSVNDVISMAQYGTSVKADGTPQRGVPLLRMGNIQDGQLDLTDLQYITRQAENIADFRLAKGDVLFNRTNSPELVGKTAVYNNEREAVFASYLIRVRCDARITLGKYLSSWLNSPWGRWWARTVRTDGVSQSNINASKLRSMPLPLPPLQEQIEILRRLNALFALAANIERSVQAAQRRTEKLSQAILAKAFRGELVPTEAELARREGRDYEPASVLLDRMHAERAKRAKTPAVPKRKLRRASAHV